LHNQTCQRISQITSPNNRFQLAISTTVKITPKAPHLDIQPLHDHLAPLTHAPRTTCTQQAAANGKYYRDAYRQDVARDVCWRRAVMQQEILHARLLPHALHRT
jgi:hypothetical protein